MCSLGVCLWETLVGLYVLVSVVIAALLTLDCWLGCFLSCL